MANELAVERVKEIKPMRDDLPDDFFITCGSFEDRFLGVPKIIRNDLFRDFVIFKFEEINERREKLIKEMEDILFLCNSDDTYHKIHCTHGKSMEAVIKFNQFLQTINMHERKLFITIDMSTFTKDLLINLIMYLINFTSMKKLRLLYTIPKRYASAGEGWLSSGIKSIHIPPLSWNAWSPVKDNLLIVILGFEEIRAWSLIERFSTDRCWLFTTNPGSKAKWNNYCGEYNKRLINKKLPIGNIPALNPFDIAKTLSTFITNESFQKYNIFLCPLGTKPQVVGILYLITMKSLPLNLLTTTAISHNIPYYSSGIEDTFEFYFPLRGDRND